MFAGIHSKHVHQLKALSYLLWLHACPCPFILKYTTQLICWSVTAYMLRILKIFAPSAPTSFECFIIIYMDLPVKFDPDNLEHAWSFHGIPCPFVGSSWFNLNQTTCVVACVHGGSSYNIWFDFNTIKFGIKSEHIYIF